MSNIIISKFRGEYSFLSNMYKCNIIYGGILYKSVENAFQAAKSSRLDEKYLISSLSPVEAKRYAKSLYRSDWNEVKDSIMLDLLRIKFKNNYLMNKLLDTGEATIIEVNYWHDNYWGSCDCRRCEKFIKENKLGKLLMQVRDEIKYNR